MSKLIVEYYLTGSRTPTYILTGGMYNSQSVEYGETYVGITTGSISESELPTGVNVLTRNQFLSRSMEVTYSIVDPITTDDGAGWGQDVFSEPVLTNSEMITVATALSASWAAL